MNPSSEIWRGNLISNIFKEVLTMSIFGSLLKTAFDVATSPIDVVKDVVTLGGALTDEHELYTVQKLKQLAEDAEDIRNDLSDL